MSASELATNVVTALGGTALALAIAAYLGRRWLEQQLGKDLEKYKSELTHQLEGVKQGLSLDRERYSRDYGLFATRRNEVYAETYGLFESARGAYGAHFGRVVERREFTGAGSVDLAHLARSLKRISEQERAELLDLLKTPGMLSAAGKLGTRLYERDSLRRAQGDSAAFLNASILHSLYFSPAVEVTLEEVRKTLRILTRFAAERIAGEEPREYREPADLIEKLDWLAVRLREEMRDEMKQGFVHGAPLTVPPTPPAAPPAPLD